jgi:peptidoglycan/LPS O-acetylase OafA/YrhL
MLKTALVPDAASQNTGPRYPVLDALRFVLAFWVVVGHFGIFPLFAGVDTNTPLGRTLDHGWNSLVFGTPAVIGFFVISGFCIHLPFREERRLLIGRYYARRYTRILVPLAFALLLFHLSGMHLRLLGEHSVLWQSILWSLACEEIYYAIYPFLRIFRNRLGWRILLPVAFILAVCVAATQRYAPDWHPYGPFFTALILLPVWLLGCLLAEQVVTLPAEPSSLVVWKWRLLIWFGSWLCEMLHFKAHISYTHTMIWFGILAYFWIKAELAYSMHRQPHYALVSAGAWSYSLYLVHEPVFMFYQKWQPPNLGIILNWVVSYGSMLVASYLFYLAIEKPSHRLARRIRFSPARSGPSLAVGQPAQNTISQDSRSLSS